MNPPTPLYPNSFAEMLNAIPHSTTSSIPVPLIYDATDQPFREEPYLTQHEGDMQLESTSTLEIDAPSNPYDNMSIDELKVDLDELLERVKITDTTGPEWDRMRMWLVNMLIELGIVAVQQASVVPINCYEVPIPSYYQQVPMLQAY